MTACVCGISPWTGIAQVCLWHYGESKARKRRQTRRPNKRGRR